MRKDNPSDTIAAISTPPGESGIGIVRLSGKQALAIADRIFLSKDGGRPSGFGTYTVHYGWIADVSGSQKPNGLIDEVILTVMRAPKSYTKEDVVEINCHGGIVALRQVLDLVLLSGARMSRPGEFTERAFLNGRIDLAQAEAVLDIIKAKTDYALRIGIEQLKGALSKTINKIRNELLGILSALEADIDFPDEETGALDAQGISRKLMAVDGRLKSVLEGANYGRILRDGVHAVICGKPNVGKSSLLNALLKQERSIVTAIAGTTRDTVEEIINIKGIPVRVVDTAGIINPRDVIERKAVQRSRHQVNVADLAILLFDGSRRLDRQDAFLINKLKKKNTIAVINKIDLRQKISREILTRNFKQVIDISAKKSKNINLLEDGIAESVYRGGSCGLESVMMSNQRHIDALRKAEKLVAAAAGSLDNKLSFEFVAQDIREALGELDSILGKRFCEGLLDKIFSEFCIGK